MKKITYLFVISLLLSGCKKPIEEGPKNTDLCILFTNDVHCKYENGVGYAGVASLKKECSASYSNCLLVDSGDFTQGGAIASISEGKASIDIVNEIGYDYAILGNHEFDYGLAALKENIHNFNGKLLNSNVTYTGKNANPFADTVKYDILDLGDYKVGFIGISTPLSISTSKPLNFIEDNNYVVSFGESDTISFANTIQNVVNEVKAQGVNYVVALSHLGYILDETNSDYKYSSNCIATLTKDIDIFLDGHSHTEIDSLHVKNSEQKDTLICQTGTELNAVGKLVITKDGIKETSLIKEGVSKNEETSLAIAEISDMYGEKLKEIISHSDYDLSIYDENGIRMVRSREVGIGNFVADAYKATTGATIGYTNGGGVRDSIKKGDITVEQIININPFGNSLCSVEVTGQDLFDMFEYFVEDVQSEYVKNNQAYGENGSFPQISGLKIEIDTSIPSSVVKEDNETAALLSIGNTRRITKMEVIQDNGSYAPVDPSKTYTFATTNYVIKNGGCGMKYLLQGKKLVLDESIADYQSLIDYVKTLNNDYSKYASQEGRVVVK